MMKHLAWMAVAALALSGCMEEDRGEMAEIPPPEGTKVKLDVAKVEKGKQIFNTMCVACHQPDGVGRAGIAPKLNSPDFLGLASDRFLRDSILEGRQGTAMMAYKNIPMVADDVDSVVAFIRSWQNGYENFRDYGVDPDVKIKGDATAGMGSFRNYCASCHGLNGGGYADGGSGLAIGLSGFLQVASDDYIKKTIEVGRAGTAMRPFGHGRGLADLPEPEIDNIVTYLRSLEK